MRLAILTAAVITFPMSVRAQVTLYENDYEGFLEEAEKERRKRLPCGD